MLYYFVKLKDRLNNVPSPGWRKPPPKTGEEITMLPITGRQVPFKEFGWKLSLIALMSLLWNVGWHLHDHLPYSKATWEIDRAFLGFGLIIPALCGLIYVPGWIQDWRNRRIRAIRRDQRLR